MQNARKLFNKWTCFCNRKTYINRNIYSTIKKSQRYLRQLTNAYGKHACRALVFTEALSAER